MQPKVHFV